MRATAWRLLFCCLVALAGTGRANAAFVVTCSFSGSAGNQTSEPADANPANGTAGAISRGSGLTASAGADSINSSGFTTGSSIDANDYYTLTISADAGFVL